jgi:hypothetical protein
MIRLACDNRKCRRNRRRRKFVVCIWNKRYEGELHKNHQKLSDHHAERHRLIRVIDESGEDYLYPADWFCPVGKEGLYSSRRIRHSAYFGRIKNLSFPNDVRPATEEELKAMEADPQLCKRRLHNCLVGPCLGKGTHAFEVAR